MLTISRMGIEAAFVAAPMVALLVAVLRRNQNGRQWARLATGVAAGVISGSAVCFIHASVGGGAIGAGQIALTMYFATSLCLLIAMIDRWVVASLRAMWRRDDDADDAITARRKLIETLPFLIRATVLIALVLPYLFATALTYRAKAIPRVNPASMFGGAFERARFRTDDGYLLAGWWMPANLPASSRRTWLQQARIDRRRFARDTVILCHGIGSTKSGMLELARMLTLNGYNVFMFDFRAHGESEGQLSSLGDLERQDVLAAVRWVQQAHPRQTNRVLGLGVSTGAAALIFAAADRSPAGQSIEAITVIGAFDDVSAVARTVARERFLPPLSWVADRVGLALASAQVGSDLSHCAPASAVQSIWPRPILVIHGGADQVIPFQHGQNLFDAAAEPKRCLWLPWEDYGGAIASRATLNAVREFFDEARRVSAI